MSSSKRGDEASGEAGAEQTQKGLQEGFQTTVCRNGFKMMLVASSYLVLVERILNGTMQDLGLQSRFTRLFECYLKGGAVVACRKPSWVGKPQQTTPLLFVPADEVAVPRRYPQECV